MSKTTNKGKQGGVVVYQTKTGAIELKGDFKRETIWASQAQIANVFNIERSVVTKHIGAVLKDKEVDEKSNVQKMHIADSDKPVVFYSLDIILAVGYRSNSANAIAFRQWATKTLREHITNGFTINRSRIRSNYESFMKTVSEVQALLPSGGAVDASDALELMSLFAETWLSLGSYDKGELPRGKPTKKAVKLTADRLQKSLSDLRDGLMVKEEATDMFGNERHEGAVSGIVGNVMQSFGGQELYPSVEEKAANLLYFMVKNHPFADGNKRSGAFAFVWYLRQARVLDTARITPPALTALTIVVAESDPKHKDRVISLILNLISTRK